MLDDVQIMLVRTRSWQSSWLSRLVMHDVKTEDGTGSLFCFASPIRTPSFEPVLRSASSTASASTSTAFNLSASCLANVVDPAAGGPNTITLGTCFLLSILRTNGRGLSGCSITSCLRMCSNVWKISCFSA
eukprot:TRINITY_DN9682_c0_g1_i3.p3 TRINITY_DN9682_c0_g1~~TRINITY_DN9682_c0_g1_i3.p3  ORF type:complete len:131 (-),score=3.07 TRINITY_DN9682_c0_g1_i3:75-467(-)